MSEALTITIRSTDKGFEAEVWCPAFVDHGEFESIEDALAWARTRLDGTDPFEEYGD